MNTLANIWSHIKPTKIKRTTFGVVTSHIISSTFLFPLFWLLVGSFAKVILVEKGIIIEAYATTLYYLIMLGFFYVGIKYSLYYIDKRVVVALPRQSAQQSIIFFGILVVTVNIGFVYFEDTINFQRIIFSVLLVYMFAKMTNKYFNSLEQADYLECNFFNQIIILLANFSLFVTFLFIYAIIDKLNPIVNIIIIIVVFYLAIFIKDFNKIFIPFFYLPEESKPIKKAWLILFVTFPLNIGLWMIILHYFENLYDYI